MGEERNCKLISDKATERKVGQCYRIFGSKDFELKIVYNPDFIKENYLITFEYGDDKITQIKKMHYGSIKTNKQLLRRNLKCDRDIKNEENGRQYREIIDIAINKVVGKYYTEDNILQIDTNKISLEIYQPIIHMC